MQHRIAMPYGWHRTGGVRHGGLRAAPATALALACLGLAAVAYVGWASSVRVALGLFAVWALGVWWAGKTWRHLPRGRLCWDRQAWSWQANADGDTAGAAAEEKCIAITALKVAIDMQIALGLHVKTDVGSYFFWVQAPSSRHPHDWLALRRAVYSSPSWMLQPPVQ